MHDLPRALFRQAAAISGALSTSAYHWLESAIYSEQLPVNLGVLDGADKLLCAKFHRAAKLILLSKFICSARVSQEPAKSNIHCLTIWPVTYLRLA